MEVDEAADIKLNKKGKPRAGPRKRQKKKKKKQDGDNENNDDEDGVADFVVASVPPAPAAKAKREPGGANKQKEPAIATHSAPGVSPATDTRTPTGGASSGASTGPSSEASYIWPATNHGAASSSLWDGWGGGSRWSAGGSGSAAAAAAAGGGGSGSGGSSRSGSRGTSASRGVSAGAVGLDVLDDAGLEDYLREVFGAASTALIGRDGSASPMLSGRTGGSEQPASQSPGCGGGVVGVDFSLGHAALGSSLGSSLGDMGSSLGDMGSSLGGSLGSLCAGPSTGVDLGAGLSGLGGAASPGVPNDYAEFAMQLPAESPPTSPGRQRRRWTPLTARSTTSTAAAATAAAGVAAGGGSGALSEALSEAAERSRRQAWAVAVAEAERRRRVSQLAEIDARCPEKAPAPRGSSQKQKPPPAESCSRMVCLVNPPL